MSTTISDIHQLTRQGRAFSPALLACAEDPHAELLTMVWGPRFNREHALGLWAHLSRRHPLDAAPDLPVLLSAADRFDALDATGQHRLRQLILRHRTLSDGNPV